MHLLDDGNRFSSGRPPVNVWITTRTLNRIIKRCANRAMIVRPTSPHVLRHTFAVQCLRKGIHPVVLMKLLGHEKFSTTQSYQNLCPEDVIDEFRRKWKRRPSED
jgi:integrase/recombinase XerD